MRILGLDYGEKTVGVAACDTSLESVRGIEVIRRDKENKIRRTLVRIEELIRECGIEMIVLGLPLNMDETEGERALKTREFAALLEKRTGLRVAFQDERLSSFEAEDRMKQSGAAVRKQKQIVDMVAAEVILEDWLAGAKEL